jgi:dephospho-CoA kinase
MSTNSVVIGLTGNIATGKSTVAEYLKRHGACAIDADRVTHQVMEAGGAAYEGIVAEFGAAILDEQGAVDRRKLGEIVFGDAERLGRLEQIVHPAVFAWVYNKIKASTAKIVVLEAIKLLEAGTMAGLCDEIWVVAASPATQVRRSLESRGMPEEETRRRMGMQSPQAAKVNQADRVIDNNGTLAELYAQLDRIWADLQRKFAARLETAEA